MRTPTHAKFTSLTERTIAALNGTYTNIPDSGHCYHRMNTLWSQLSIKPLDSVKQPGQLVQLEVVNPHLVYARLLDDTLLVQQQKLKGRLKNGCFYLRRKSRFRGVPFIVYSSLGLKTRLGLDNSGQLFADSEYSHGGGIFILSAGTTEYCSQKYARKQAKDKN